MCDKVGQLGLTLTSPFQMLSVSDTELQWIVKHLGHSMKVHQTFYRAMSSTIEHTKIAKLLILADSGKIAAYQGRRLEEVSFEGDFIIWSSQLAVVFLFTISYTNDK